MTRLPDALQQEKQAGGDENAADAEQGDGFLSIGESLGALVRQSDEEEERRLEQRDRKSKLKDEKL